MIVEEFLRKAQVEGNWSAKKIMIEFTRYHVQEALREASEKARMKVYDSHSKTNSQSEYIQHGANNIQIDKETILSAYSIENIK